MRTVLVLAAGASRRFGRADKLLAILHGTPLVLHALERARATGVRRIYVTVSTTRTLRLVARHRSVVPVRVRDARAGLSASLMAGLRALRPIEREVLVFLGDMPFAAAPRALRLAAGMNGVRPWWRGEPGHPMLIRVSAARAALLDGDRGLGRMSGIGRVRGNRGNLLDIDSRAALRRARAGSRIVPGR